MHASMATVDVHIGPRHGAGSRRRLPSGRGCGDRELRLAHRATDRKPASAGRAAAAPRSPPPGTRHTDTAARPSRGATAAAEAATGNNGVSYTASCRAASSHDAAAPDPSPGQSAGHGACAGSKTATGPGLGINVGTDPRASAHCGTGIGGNRDAPPARSTAPCRRARTRAFASGLRRGIPRQSASAIPSRFAPQGRGR